MDKVSLEGKEYVKAATVARELGYTRDYIGQLCRAKKIDAQLVGRSWYVYMPSLQEHKKQRYQSVRNSFASEATRSAQEGRPIVKEGFAKKVAAVSVNDDVQSSASPKEEDQKVANYEERLARFGSPKYYSDEDELLPNLTKNPGSKHASVLEGAIEVKVLEDDETPSEYAVSAKTAEKPLKGSLKVQDLSKGAKTDKKPKNKHIKVREGQFEHAKKGEVEVKSLKKPIPVSFEDKVKSALVTGPRPAEEFPELIKAAPNAGVNKLMIPMPVTLSVVAGAVVFALAVGLSWNMNMEGSETDSGYGFNVSSVIGSE